MPMRAGFHRAVSYGASDIDQRTSGESALVKTRKLSNLRRLVRDISPQPAILHVETNVSRILGGLQSVTGTNIIVIAARDDRHRADDPDSVLIDHKTVEPIFGARETVKKFGFRTTTAVALNMNIILSGNLIERHNIGVEQRSDACRFDGEYLLDFQFVGRAQTEHRTADIPKWRAEKCHRRSQAPEKTSRRNR